MKHQAISDGQMVKIMGLVMGALVLFFLFILLVANILSKPSNTSPNAVQRNAMVERLNPVGTIRTRADDEDEVKTKKVTAAVPNTGQQLAVTCLACHGAAVASALGAPALGDTTAWQARLINGGLDALVNNAINGKGAMPARGGSSLNDTQIRLAVEYLIGQ